MSINDDQQASHEVEQTTVLRTDIRKAPQRRPNDTPSVQIIERKIPLTWLVGAGIYLLSNVWFAATSWMSIQTRMTQAEVSITEIRSRVQQQEDHWNKASAEVSVVKVMLDNMSKTLDRLADAKPTTRR